MVPLHLCRINCNNSHPSPVARIDIDILHKACQQDFLVPEHVRLEVTMLLVVVLQELAQVPEHSRALLALIRKIRGIQVSSICQHGCIREIGLHSALAGSKAINVLARVLLPGASTAKSTLEVLYGVGTGSEPTLTTNGTGNVSFTVHLHVHVELVLRIEFSITLVALVDNGRRVRVPIHTVLATRVPISLGPLVAAEA